MKKTIKHILLLVSLVIFLGSCTSNSTDITNILSPYLIPNQKNTKLLRVSSQDSLGNTSVNIHSGEPTIIANISGPALITHIWIDPGQQDPSVLRQMMIRMYWDKETIPSVEVPFSDFFGCGFGYKEYNSIYLGMSGGSFYCLFPLPFEETARIELYNESGKSINNVSYQIDYQRIETFLSREVGYFHAYWRRDVRTDYDSDFLILKTRGRGHVVGVNLNIQSYNGKFDYLSGVEKVFVDGEKRPSITGTGTSDFFMGGNGFQHGIYQTPVSGLIYKDDSLGRISAYRYMIQDAIPFKKSIVFSIEHGRGNQDITDYSSTVYWYESEPHQAMPPVPKAAQRIPLRTVTAGHLFEAENLNIQLGKLKAHVEDMSEMGPEWSGSKEYIIETQDKSEFTVTFDKLEEVSYDVEIYYTRGPQFGNVGVYNGSEKVGEIKGYSPSKVPGGKITLKNIKNPEYSIVLRFNVQGKDSLSEGFMVGLDGINLNPNREYIPEWKTLGPFQITAKNTRHQKINIDNVFPPEKDINDKDIDLSMKHLIRQVVKPGADGYVSLDKLIRPNEPVMNYVMTNVWSPVAKIVSFYIGSDDAIKVFLNGKQVYRYVGIRFARPDQSQIFLRLQPGWNTLMLKVGNQTGNSGFYARILDRDRTLKYSTVQKLQKE
jgi:hypothetical protein